MRRTLLCSAALAGGLTAAQLPEFSQQYVQRLGGAVDALEKVVTDFDTSARSAGLTREAALAELAGSDFLERRQADMRRTFTRYEQLSAQRAQLSNAPASARVAAILRAPDPELAAATYADFRPALPATSDGLLFGGGGFLSTLLALSGVALVFRRRRMA